MMGAERTRQPSVMSADARALAGTYAQALLDHLDDIARAESPAARPTAAGRAADELAGAAALLKEIRGAAELFTMPQSVTARCDLVDRVFGGRVSEPVHALLGVMARRGRLGLLGAAARAFGALLDARQGKIDVTVTTALELTDDQRRRLGEDLQRTFDAECVLTARVDPGILGGVTVQVGDALYDASLASGLSRFGRQVADRLAASGRHEKGASSPRRGA